MGVIADAERFRERRDPWDCAPGQCFYSEVRTLPPTNREYRECLYCHWRVFRNPGQAW